MYSLIDIAIIYIFVQKYIKMLDATVKYLTTRLSDTGLFASVNGIVDMITEPSSKEGAPPMRYPAIYKGKDAARFISLFDFKTGVAFFLPGRTTSSAEQSKRVCASFIRESQRPELYVITRRDEAGSLEALKLRLTRALTITNSKSAREATGASVINGTVTAFETDPETVLRDVFENIDIPHRLDLAFIRVDLSYDFYYYSDCLIPACP